MAHMNQSLTTNRMTCLTSEALALLCNFGRGLRYSSVNFFSNLCKWFRCRLKDFLSGALATLLFSRAEPFMQFWKRAAWGKLFKFGSVDQDKMSFKEKFKDDGRTTDAGWRPITIPHLEPSAQLSQKSHIKRNALISFDFFFKISLASWGLLPPAPL